MRLKIAIFISDWNLVYYMQTEIFFEPENLIPMKKLIISILAFLIFSTTICAQIHLFLQEQEVDLKDGKSSAWVFPVARELDEALDDLKQYAKDRSDVKMKDGGKNLMIAEKVSIPTIVTLRGDLIGHGFITESYYGIGLVFQMGYDISVNSREWSSEMGNFRNYAKEFMSYHYEQSYARRVEVLEKEIKSLNKQKNQNEGKIENMTKKIATLNKRIAKETDSAKIEANKSEITTLESDIHELSDALPPLVNQIALLQTNIDKLKNESNAYHSAIGSI